METKMKTLTLTSLMLLSISAANAFSVNARVSWNNYQAQAEVCNYYNQPIMCQGRAQGFTQSGHTVYASLYPSTLYPGQCTYFYVYTNTYNPFINASAYANCQFGY